jgi:hypothetical protein
MVAGAGYLFALLVCGMILIFVGGYCLGRGHIS